MTKQAPYNITHLESENVRQLAITSISYTFVAIRRRRRLMLAGFDSA